MLQIKNPIMLVTVFVANIFQAWKVFCFCFFSEVDILETFFNIQGSNHL